MRLVSLWDMYVCNGDLAVHLVKELEWLETSHRGDGPWSGTDLEIRTDLILKMADRFVIGASLDEPIKRILKIRLLLGGNIVDPAATRAQEIKVLRELIINALQSRLVLILALGRYEYYDNRKWFGDAVHDAFGDASKDMVAAGNCYAIEESTACVFHSMRVAEYGMRALAKHLHVTVKRGRPIEYDDWGHLIQALRKKLEELHKTSKGPKREEQLQRYSGLADQCAYFNNLWRTEVSHARKIYLDSEALTALTRTRDFMERLMNALAKTKVS